MTKAFLVAASIALAALAATHLHAGEARVVIYDAAGHQTSAVSTGNVFAVAEAVYDGEAVCLGMRRPEWRHGLVHDRQPRQALWALDFYSKHSGNWYPTHGLGPVAKYMDINRGDNFDFLVSLDSKQANYHHCGRELYKDWRKDFKTIRKDYVKK